MSIVAAPPPLRIPVLWRSDSPRLRCLSMMKDDLRMATNDPLKMEAISPVVHRGGSVSSEPSDLRFNRLQPLDAECDCKHKRVFGRYIAREALIDEEFWTAAWLRAESHWEDRADARHANTFMRQFAEQEFNAIKRRCRWQQLDESSTCIIVVKKDEVNIKRTVLSSIVGTLDISIKHLLCGETFPGERIKGPLSCNIFGRKDQPTYGYVSNLSVAKYARRQGIASNMLLLAVEAANSYGVDNIYVHVYKDNMGARKLYENLGFEMVKEAMPESLKGQKYLLCLKKVL